MANQVYENFVLENKLEDMFTTHVDMNQFLTLDNSLTVAAGMKKIVNTYTATGDVEEVLMGAGNTQSIETAFTSSEYIVGTTQGRFQFYDEQAMTDPYIVEVGLKGIAAKMANDLTAKAIAEFGKATLIQSATGSISFDNVVDAISLLNLEEESGLFMLVNPAQVAGIRKGLKDLLSYSEGFVRTGYIGSVSGVPVFNSKAVPAATAFLGDRTAVTAFVKKGMEIEQERDANIRQTSIYGRKVALAALTDATKIVKIAIA